MLEQEISDIELAPQSVVMQAARDFTAVLADTPQFIAFEEAAHRLNYDERAKQAVQALHDRQQSLQAVLMLNSASKEELAELERLRQAYLSEPSVIAYFQAQTDLMILCQSVASLISNSIGLDYAASCGASCCG
jgi:cell fate (sporulation/competence/biofilm development) regulator YlbF (YheA/YmcA/DUF963 family)